MKKLTLIILSLLFLSACSPQNTGKVSGEHALLALMVCMKIDSETDYVYVTKGVGMDIYDYIHVVCKNNVELIIKKQIKVNPKKES